MFTGAQGALGADYKSFQSLMSGSAIYAEAIMSTEDEITYFRPGFWFSGNKWPVKEGLRQRRGIQVQVYINSFLLESREAIIIAIETEKW